MKTKIVSTVVIALAVLIAAPAFAKTAGGKGKGVFCTQGGDNIFIPAAHFSAKVRAIMRKGQKIKVNLSGYGPISCVVY
jgi:hypothetical protein